LEQGPPSPGNEHFLAGEGATPRIGEIDAPRFAGIRAATNEHDALRIE
jgi:hypothetical protein